MFNSARFALDRRTRANANTQCFIPGKELIIARRALSGIQYFRSDRVRVCVPTEPTFKREAWNRH